jgi:hypothetical protein
VGASRRAAAHASLRKGASSGGYGLRRKQRAGRGRIDRRREIKTLCARAAHLLQLRQLLFRFDALDRRVDFEIACERDNRRDDLRICDARAATANERSIDLERIDRKVV